MTDQVSIMESESNAISVFRSDDDVEPRSSPESKRTFSPTDKAKTLQLEENGGDRHSRNTDIASTLKDSGYSDIGQSRNQTPDYTSEESSSQFHRPLLKKRHQERTLSAIEDDYEGHPESYTNGGRERPALISSEFNSDR